MIKYFQQIFELLMVLLELPKVYSLPLQIFQQIKSVGSKHFFMILNLQMSSHRFGTWLSVSTPTVKPRSDLLTSFCVADSSLHLRIDRYFCNLSLNTLLSVYLLGKLQSSNKMTIQSLLNYLVSYQLSLISQNLFSRP